MATTDIPLDVYCDLGPLFDCQPEQTSLPTITDATQEMVNAGECQLDCVRKVWQKRVQNFWTSSGWAEYELVVSLYKLDSQEQAESNVAALHETILNAPYGSEYSEALTDYCRDRLPGSTWLVDWTREQDSEKRLTLGASRGQVVLTVESNVTGDDGIFFACTVSGFAALQFDKLARLGFVP